MESIINRKEASTRTRSWSFFLLPFALLLSLGCVTLNSLVSPAECPPSGPVCQVITMWNNQVVWTPDPTRSGAPTPGLAGRVYFFGPDLGAQLSADGGVVVDLYDETAVPPGGQPVLLEEWRIDKDTFNRLLKKDAWGWGYTLFLPWGTYKPEITRVNMRLRFEPAKGGIPLYAQASPLTLMPDERHPVGGLAKGNNPGAPNAGLAGKSKPGPITQTSGNRPSPMAPKGR